MIFFLALESADTPAGVNNETEVLITTKTRKRPLPSIGSNPI